MLVGDILTDVGDIDGARAAYLVPKPGPTQYVAARGKLAWTYQTAGDKDDGAEDRPRRRRRRSGQPRTRPSTLADLLRADEHYDESAEVLERADRRPRATRPDWRLLYMRAVDFSESGRWAEAERDLTRP